MPPRRWTSLLPDPRLAGRVAGAVVIVALLSAGWRRASDQGDAGQRPNVLFIAVDDLRPTIGAFGDPYAKTPNLDRLARSGATFLQAYAQQALCNPSRASLLTGLRPDSIRVWDLETDFRANVPDVVTLPQHFMQHGYRTVEIGKIYHNTLPDSRSWHQEIHLSGFPYDPDAVYHGRENLAIQAERKARLIREGKQASAIDRLGMWYLKANATESLDLPDNAYYDGAQTDRALGELAALKGRQPFFFAVGYYRPHLPFNAPRKYWDLYDPDSIALAPNPDLPKDAPAVAASNLAELRGYAGFATAPDPWQGRISEADARRLKHGYYASVSYVDALVGRLLDRLDELGLAKNTIVVLWGDHGFKLGEMNGWAKMSNYLVDTHSPLIIRAPGVGPAGLRLEQLVELVDVYPTLSELAGLPVPGWLQGTSAVPLLRRPDRPWKRAAFSQFLRRGRWLGADGVETMGYGMRTERFHYVAWMNWATRQITARELYDLKSDSLETVNLAGRPELRAVLDELEAQRRGGWREAQP
ncbi:MAG TPA: sulfatase [Gemmatimonadales bacterium]|nr:sulfatase [Gemmatimonadales bacterium]